MSGSLHPDHFLNQPRPDFIVGRVDGFVDTTTLAAHDFDVDTRTGFMPTDPPISRLPIEWEPWETALDQAMSMKLQLAVKTDLTQHEMAHSALWRESVRRNVSYSPFDLLIIRSDLSYSLSNAIARRMCGDPDLPYLVARAFNKGPVNI